LQQLKKTVKKLIHTDDEHHSFLSFDYSQIEFRLIVHYARVVHAIKAYHEDPYTDFHQWVAEMCGVDRRPAKNMNFCIGYGGGKKRMTQMLAADSTIIGDLKDKFSGERFVEECGRRAARIYESYHEALPTLKPVSLAAAQKCRRRGYVFNAYGRHRHLPMDHAHKAFNSLCQSSAADLMKNRMVAAREYLSGTDVTMRVQVHDELLFHGPTEQLRDPELLRGLVGVLNEPDAELSVPIRGKMGISGLTWYDANSQERIPEELIDELGAASSHELSASP
jgi:DNA polymerase-1